MPRTTLVLLAAAALALSACKSSPEEAPAPKEPAAPSGLRATDTDPPVTVDFDRRGPEGARDVSLPKGGGLAPGAFCPTYSEIVCRKIFACASPKTIAADAEAHAFSDEAGCQAKILKFCGDVMLPGVADSVAAGRVKWDGPGFRTCFAGWVEQACTQPLGDLPATDTCRGSSVGTVPIGDRCTSAFDCAEVEGEEVLCALNQDGEGVCERLKGPGEPCDYANQECREGLVCREDTCQERGAIGEVCTFDTDCVEGLACREGRCRKRFP